MVGNAQNRPDVVFGEVRQARKNAFEGLISLVNDAAIRWSLKSAPSARLEISASSLDTLDGGEIGTQESFDPLGLLTRQRAPGDQAVMNVGQIQRGDVDDFFKSHAPRQERRWRRQY